MSALTHAEVVGKLRELNPGRNVEVLVRYADAYLQYWEAVENIERNGIVTAHPRTGAPLENPYLRIRNDASATLAGLRVIADGLWGGR